MLDMGGVPPNHDKSSLQLNHGQNNKLQAIAIDFNLITRSAEDAKKKESAAQERETSSFAIVHSSTSLSSAIGNVKPNVGLIQDIADLLNVEMGGTSTKKKKSMDDDDGDVVDSAALLAKPSDEDKSSAYDKEIAHESQDQSVTTTSATAKHKPLKLPPSMSDIRSKYASKVQQKLDGGVSTLERQKEETSPTRGDGATHLAARVIAAKHRAVAGPAKWLATSGTAKLLQYMSSRSMKIALLPIPNSPLASSTSSSSSSADQVGKAMEELTHQLSQVRFHLLLKDGFDKSAATIVKQVRDQMALDNIQPIHTLVVSDRDDYLREARDLGMYTCRIRPKNARRGNVTTNFNVETIAEVEEVINGVNGLSFNSVFSSAR